MIIVPVINTYIVFYWRFEKNKSGVDSEKLNEGKAGKNIYLVHLIEDLAVEHLVNLSDVACAAPAAVPVARTPLSYR